MNTNRILWAAMASSLIAFFVITQVVPPGTTDGSVLNIALPVLAVVDLGLSFVIPRLLVQFQDQPVAGTRGALLLALAICESVALMGLILHLTTGWPYAWTLFVLGGLGMLLHFPRG